MRLFSVTEELLPIDPLMFQPAPLEEDTVLRFGLETGLAHSWDRPHQWHRPVQTQTALSVGLLGGQIHVVGPTQSSLMELLETIRIGRALADRAARGQERRAVALGSPVSPMSARHHEGATIHDEASSDLRQKKSSMGGFRMHVAVESTEEGVQVLDRMRIWLPVLLALSANSPFLNGHPTRFSSHRYFAGSRWPAPGPSEIFGSEEQYELRMRHLTHPAAARSATVTNLDAQLSDTRETLDVLLADVCMDPEHAAVLAAISRALVETLARQWRQGTPPVPASVAQLRTATWLGAMNGLDGKLVDPPSGRERAPKDVAAGLLDFVRPVLTEYGDWEQVEAGVADMVERGTGSRRQRETYAVRHQVGDVVEAALRATHCPNEHHGVPGAILAEAWALLDSQERLVGAASG